MPLGKSAYAQSSNCGILDICSFQQGTSIFLWSCLVIFCFRPKPQERRRTWQGKRAVYEDLFSQNLDLTFIHHLIRSNISLISCKQCTHIDNTFATSFLSLTIYIRIARLFAEKGSYHHGKRPESRTEAILSRTYSFSAARSKLDTKFPSSLSLLQHITVCAACSCNLLRIKNKPTPNTLWQTFLNSVHDEVV